jgi:transposase
MPNTSVDLSSRELQSRILTTTQTEPYLPQAKQIEVVD